MSADVCAGKLLLIWRSFRRSAYLTRHGLGDCRKPLATSAALIEEIVYRHLQRVLYQAEEAARLRHARFIGLEEFIFILRRNKVKLKRLLRFLEYQDVRSMSLKAMEDEEVTEPGTAGKRKRSCRRFLSTIDQTGELLTLLKDDGVDDIKQDRLLRAEMQTRCMDPQQYKEFCTARQASFTPKYRSQKFKEWLFTDLNLEIRPNQHGVEILSYLAYECTAQIVDMALLVRQDMKAEVSDPFQQVLPPVCINHASLAVMQHANQPPNLTTSVTGFGAAPVRSPKSSPPSSPSSPTTDPLDITGSKLPKAKKRKKGSQLSGKEMFAGQALQPHHIHEAVRRFNLCSGPFDCFMKEPTIALMKKVICL
ncbi:hypothetical protein CAPTEDRAFT_221143 [Capitella teleta]|uniref:Transcription initiation protein SPT3 homolog n=1 Tax=Capitella teleta TaxID=283909 RepID=R7UT13_CAPTE|nr:hypothetical protein CAPTEDRAFT_221143 [Capitella teleta]|eukprot:ELU09308.1 hypothetical protein CAPTEDRAFT_221143 [Capitella teleta]